jgi:hypothetical protein
MVLVDSSLIFWLKKSAVNTSFDLIRTLPFRLSGARKRQVAIQKARRTEAVDDLVSQQLHSSAG